jgi:hypothetical protein
MFLFLWVMHPMSQLGRLALDLFFLILAICGEETSLAKRTGPITRDCLKIGEVTFDLLGLKWLVIAKEGGYGCSPILFEIIDFR